MEETKIVRLPSDYQLLGAFYLRAVADQSKEKSMLDIGVHFADHRPIFMAKKHPANFITVMELEHCFERGAATEEMTMMAYRVIQKVGGLVVLDAQLTHRWAIPCLDEEVVTDTFMHRRQQMLNTATVPFSTQPQSSL